MSNIRMVVRHYMNAFFKNLGNDTIVWVDIDLPMYSQMIL